MEQAHVAHADSLSNMLNVTAMAAWYCSQPVRVAALNIECCGAVEELYRFIGDLFICKENAREVVNLIVAKSFMRTALEETLVDRIPEFRGKIEESERLFLFHTGQTQCVGA